MMITENRDGQSGRIGPDGWHLHPYPEHGIAYRHCHPGATPGHRHPGDTIARAVFDGRAAMVELTEERT